MFKRAFVFFVFSLFSLVLLLIFQSKPSFAQEPILFTQISLNQGLSPVHAAVDSLNHRAYVASENGIDSMLSVIDTQSDQLVALVALGTQPGGVVVDQQTRRVYVSNYYNNSVTIVDGLTNTIMGNISGSFDTPRGVAVNEELGFIYVTNIKGGGQGNPGFVTVIDASTNQVIKTINVGSDPRFVAINPTTNRVYVTSAGNDPGLSIIDGLTNEVITTLILGDVSATGVAVDTVLNRIYVAVQFQNLVYAIDGNTNAIIAEISVHPAYTLRPTGIAINSITHRAYVTNEGGDASGRALVILDTETNQVVDLISVGTSFLPVFPSVDQALRKVYVPLFGLSAVGVITEVDNVRPSIIINSPVGTVLTNTVPINVTITDDNSGVASYKYYLDGVEIPNTLTTLDLTYTFAGNHTFMVTAIDYAGNGGSADSTFIYGPTTSSLYDEVAQMYADGEITKLGSSIYDKLTLVQTYIDASDYIDARATLNALINQIEAQIDIHITAESGNLLIANINYLLSTLP